MKKLFLQTFGCQKKIHKTTLFILCILLLNNGVAHACSCVWGGSFLKAFSSSELVVRAKVLSYHGEERGIKLSMDVEVFETLKGELSKKKIRVWGDNGALCRPYVTQFPIGTEWILALNGAGSKPGDKYAISICGEYWLKVENGIVSGNIDDDNDRKSVKKLPLDDFRRLFIASIPQEK